MPTPADLQSIEVDFNLGYNPSAPALSPEGLLRTARAGSNVWLRPGGKIEVADGLDEVSSTNVGARLFAANTDRVSIEGGLNGNLLPYAGFLRYQNAAFLFLSEETDAQVFINETAVSGLTTSSLPGRLRVAVPDGVGGYDVFDAGFDKPPQVVPFGNPTNPSATSVIGKIVMSGSIGVAVAPWRSTTDSIGPPSTVAYIDIPPTDGSTGVCIVFVLPDMQVSAGQDGWIYCGTRWGESSGEIQIVRRIYTQPRGTFTATNGNPTLTGDGTKWTEDLALNDQVEVDSISGFFVESIISDTEIELTANFSGSSGSGKTMIIENAAGSWFDSSLGDLVSQDIVKPPRAAGLANYAGRPFLWGVPNTTDPNPTDATGNLILATADGNPEHVTIALAIPTASGSDLVNVLPGDGVMYLMTMTGLEVVSFTGNPDTPYIIRIVAEPGFKAGTNGAVYKDVFYGFTNRPLRTRADSNIDVEFAAPVWEEMRGWNSERVIVAVDPENEAVLYIYDNGSTTIVIPYMTQQGVWNTPQNFSARIIDAQVVGGILYVTYLENSVYRVNEWEGGAGIAGDMYISSQYYDTRSLFQNIITNLVHAGKLDSLSVYAAVAGAAVPDVSDIGAATETFALSDVDELGAEIFTKIRAQAFALRANFGSADGYLDKLIARGRPRGQHR